MVKTFVGRLGLAWLSVLAAWFGGMALLLSYTISKTKGNLHYTKLAYISDAGTIPPASCWFALFFSSLSFCFVVTIYFRFLQLRDLLVQSNKSSRCVNYASKVIGFLSSFGLLVVANFQVLVQKIFFSKIPKKTYFYLKYPQFAHFDSSKKHLIKRTKKEKWLKSKFLFFFETLWENI